MELKPCSLGDLSCAKVSFATCLLPSTPYAKALVVAFTGKADNRREFHGTYRFMNAMIAAGAAAWNPFAVVLDLRQLSYEWGDEMASALVSARDSHSGRSLPSAVCRGHFGSQSARFDQPCHTRDVRLPSGLAFRIRRGCNHGRRPDNLRAGTGWRTWWFARKLISI